MMGGEGDRCGLKVVPTLQDTLNESTSGRTINIRGVNFLSPL